MLQTPRGKIEFQSRLLGRFNLLNIMAAVSSALVKGVGADKISAALAAFLPVKGRVNIAHAGDFLVVVDYAHTDDALENLLRAFREITSGKLILVFGAGGSRDKTKRPRMAQVACRCADRVVVTSDNPRQEDPQAIIADIVAGFAPGFSGYRTEPDRRAGHRPGPGHGRRRRRGADRRQGARGLPDLQGAHRSISTTSKWCGKRWGSGDA